MSIRPGDLLVWKTSQECSHSSRCTCGTIGLVVGTSITSGGYQFIHLSTESGIFTFELITGEKDLFQVIRVER